MLLQNQNSKSVRPLRVLEPNTCLSRSQIHKRKKMLLGDCRKSLAFVGRYNMEAVSVDVRQEDGKRLRLSLDKNSVSDVKEENGSVTDLDALLYVKDSENISNKAYHELSMVVPDMPRLHSVVKRAKEINVDVKIRDTPNDTVGVQQSLRDRLTNCVSNIVASGKGQAILSKQSVNVKLTGDGTELGRRKKVINFGFTILDEDLCTSVRGNYLLAMFTGNETYDNIRKALEDIVTEAKALNTLNIGGTLVHVTYFLGGDLKFLNMVCGLASCSCTYSCVWCKCPNFDRHDMSREWSLVDVQKGARTVEEISTMSNKKNKNFNCLHPPLFSFIALTRVVPDLLHLYLRVSDQLVKHLITELRTRDTIQSSVT
ncbi:uncharacterized protein LOC124281178 [Haliotis rubra]|uniref:uncharacterized protein LOC124281178 n=1 Tax=Haliotis rubra TaxID=36100 RepID=UPI001EE5B327|nr:uncharacterized protein LOC124281178 [Haliotis rubra]